LYWWEIGCWGCTKLGFMGVRPGCKVELGVWTLSCNPKIFKFWGPFIVGTWMWPHIYDRHVDGGHKMLWNVTLMWYLICDISCDTNVMLRWRTMWCWHLRWHRFFWNDISFENKGSVLLKCTSTWDRTFSLQAKGYQLPIKLVSMWDVHSLYTPRVTNYKACFHVWCEEEDAKTCEYVFLSWEREFPSVLKCHMKHGIQCHVGATSTRHYCPWQCGRHKCVSTCGSSKKSTMCSKTCNL
jgi:hypothetical protein